MKKMLLSIWLVCIASLFPGFGQSVITNFEVIPPTMTNPEHSMYMANGEVPVHVANASFQLSSAWGMSMLNAVVYNSSSGVSYMDVLVLDDNSNVISTASVQLPIDGYLPDVIIRDDINSVGQAWIVSIVLSTHSCPVSEVHLIEYKLDDPSNININFLSSTFVGNGIYPRIDGFIDPNMIVDNELFAMTDFAVVYNNLNTTGNIQLVHYDANANPVNATAITSFVGFAPDVACMTNVNMGGTKFVYIVDINTIPPPLPFFGNIHLVLYDVTAMAEVNREYSSYPNYMPFYRIDAHSLIEDFLNQNRYIISGTHDCHDHFFLADNFIANFTVPSSYSTIAPNSTTGLLNWRPNGAHAVAAGMGYELVPGTMPPGFPMMPVGSRVNREEFTSVHSYASIPNGANLMMTNYMRPPGYNTAMPDLFWVNNVQYLYGSMIPTASREVCSTCTVFADGGIGGMSGCGHVDYSYFFSASVATQPNLGDYAVACWIDETNGSVNLKQTNNYGSMGGSIISHQADIAAVQQEVTVAPNPARDRITVSSKSLIDRIEVVNILGQRIRSYTDVNSYSFEMKAADWNTGSQAVIVNIVSEGKKHTVKVLLDQQ